MDGGSFHPGTRGSGAEMRTALQPRIQKPLAVRELAPNNRCSREASSPATLACPFTPALMGGHFPP